MYLQITRYKLVGPAFSYKFIEILITMLHDYVFAVIKFWLAIKNLRIYIKTCFYMVIIKQLICPITATIKCLLACFCFPKSWSYFKDQDCKKNQLILFSLSRLIYLNKQKKEGHVTSGKQSGEWERGMCRGGEGHVQGQRWEEKLFPFFFLSSCDKDSAYHQRDE